MYKAKREEEKVTRERSFWAFRRTSKYRLIGDRCFHASSSYYCAKRLSFSYNVSIAPCDNQRVERAGSRDRGHSRSPQRGFRMERGSRQSCGEVFTVNDASGRKGAEEILVFEDALGWRLDLHAADREEFRARKLSGIVKPAREHNPLPAEIRRNPVTPRLHPRGTFSAKRLPSPTPDIKHLRPQTTDQPIVTADALEAMGEGFDAHFGVRIER